MGKIMLGRLNHVAIAVKDAEKAAKIYGAAFAAEISAAVPLPTPAARRACWRPSHSSTCAARCCNCCTRDSPKS